MSLWRTAAPLWRGHVFLFDKLPARPVYGDRVGLRLLLIATSLEGARLAINTLGDSLLPIWFRAPLYLALALLAVYAFSGVTWSQIGLRRWREWNRIEQSYFIQVIFIANIVFASVFASPLRAIMAGPAPVTWLWTIFIPYLFYGFYQEVVYRGLLQTELARRWGAAAGILVSNALYTFGPLHAYYFSSSTSLALPMFAAIFVIGLVFAMLFKQSRNLWIVAVMHAIGNAYIVGSMGRTP
jgi:membrane protease YdiL (CAAX protease family)